jgi:SDR family mycofactocin-dependent oxidoreductase
MHMGQLDGKVAFITGAARGQGRSHAVRLAQEGADIIAIDLMEEIPAAPYSRATEDDLAETVRRVEALDRRIIASKADVRDYPGLKAALDDGVAQLGRLDIVSANAGIYSQMVPTEDIDEEIWGDQLATNLTGVWHTAKAAIPHLKGGGRGGSIVITSSGAGIRGLPNLAHYSSAKTGVVGLMRTMAIELAPHMIRVNTLHPTQVDTDMCQNETTYRLFSPELENPTREDFARVSTAMHALPVPWLEPVDVSNALLFLVSEQGRYITGATIPLSLGGY